MNPNFRNFALWVIIFLLVLALVTLFQSPGQRSGGSDIASAVMGGLGSLLFGSTGPRGGQRDGIAQTLVKSAVRQVGSSVGREIVRGVLGSLLGGSTATRRRR